MVSISYSVCYSNSVSFFGLLRIYCIHDEVCAKISCSGKVLLILKDSKIFMAIRLVLSNGSHIVWNV